MKGKAVKICSLIFAGMLAAGCMAACGDRGTTGAQENVLTIRYFTGGTGSVWLENAAEKFETSHEGVTVKLEGDSGVTSLMQTQLTSGKDLADIYMTNEFAWQEQVSMGRLADLTDVYEAEVQTKDGPVKIKDYMLDEVAESRYLSRYEGSPSVPWTMLMGFSQAGLVYNEEMLLSTPHTTAKAGEWDVGDLWTAPPETVADLVAYCNDLNAREDEILEMTGNTEFDPLTFSGNEPVWLQRLMYGWWGQYQGAEELNTANADVAEQGGGTFFDFWNYGSADVFNQAGIEAAIGAFQDVFVDLNTHQYKNVPLASTSYSTYDAERRFTQQQTAMVVGGAFIYNEMTGVRDVDGDGEDDFTMKMMMLPAVEGAQVGDDGELLKMNLYNCEDVVLIPSQATNVELAKEFLILLCEEESLLDYTKLTSELRPFKYDPMDAETEDFEYGPFALSVIENFNACDVHLVRCPVGTEMEERTLISLYSQPIWDTAYTSFTASLLTQDAGTIAENIYSGAQKEWPKWEAQVR